MAILSTQVLVGNVGRVYDLRTVGSENRKVIDFTIAVTPRKKVGDEWTDGDTYWSTVTAWGRLAENIAESFNAGDRVFVYGRTEMKPGYTNREGVEVDARPIIVAEFAGHEVSFNAATSARVAGKSSYSEASKPVSKPVESKPTATKDVFDADDDDLFGDDLDDDDVAF